MEKPRSPDAPDWADLQLLLAIAQEGSLTAAARRLATSQPTAGRRLKAVERALGFAVFTRRAEGLEPTAFGARLLETLAEMEQAALAFQRLSAAPPGQVQERLQVTCVGWLANWILAGSLARFTRAHPWVRIEVGVEDRKANLSRAEADVALRFTPFEQLDVVQRRVCSLPSALYASSEYLDAHGAPHFGQRCEGHAVLLMSASAAHVPDQQWLRRAATGARVALTSNSVDALAHAARAGMGFTVLPQVVGQGLGLVELAAPRPIPPRELWIGYHKDLRRVERVKRFVDHVFAELGS